MIKNIIELLQLAKGETDNIKIAQGKNALPKDLKCQQNKHKKMLMT